MKENIKIGLLALIAVTLIINTLKLDGSSSSNDTPVATSTVSQQSSAVAGNTANNTIQPAIQNNDPIENALPATSVEFAEMEHNFGTINQDSKNEHVFSFTNTGTEPLVISNARGSCGCTVPEYPREPIAPGESGEIKVVYSPGKQKDQQTKTVTITANTEPETTILKIKANVVEV